MTEVLPPKSVQVQARKKAEMMGSRAGNEAGLGGLPVLQAFQQFIETERRKTRARMIALTAAFLIILLAVGASGLLVAVWLARNVDSEVANVRAELLTTRSDLKRSGEDADSRLKVAEAEAASLRTNLETEKERSLKDQVALENLVERHREQMTTLSAEMEKIERRNRALERDLAEIRKVLPDLSDDIGLLLEKMDPRMAASVTPAPPPLLNSAPPSRQPVPQLPPPPAGPPPLPQAAEPLVAPPATSAPPAVLTVPVPVGEESGTGSWRLSIPE